MSNPEQAVARFTDTSFTNGLVIRDRTNTFDRFWSVVESDGKTWYPGSEGERFTPEQMAQKLGWSR